MSATSAGAMVAALTEAYRQGVTLDELGERAGIASERLQAIRDGQTPMTLDELGYLAEALGGLHYAAEWVDDDAAVTVT